MNKKLITATLALSLLASTPSFASPFTDTTDQSVEYAYQNNLMKGMTQNTFSPNSTLTRGQFATVLANLTKETPSGILPFTDVKKGAYYYGPVLWAYNNKIITGTSEYTFSPNATLNREQVASMTSAYMVKYIKGVQKNKTHFNDISRASSWARETIELSGKIFQDAGIVYGNNFEPKKAFTRLEVAKLVSHLDKLKKNNTQPTYTQPQNNPTYQRQNQNNNQQNQNYNQQNQNYNQTQQPQEQNQAQLEWLKRQKELEQKQKEIEQQNNENKKIKQEFNQMLREITNQPYTPSEEEQIMMDMVNAERVKVGAKPLKFLPELKSIADIRVREAHEWYKLYAKDESKAPSNQPTPHYRKNGTDPYYIENINQNMDLFINTKFHSIFENALKHNLIYDVMFNKFGENLCYGPNNVKTHTNALINSKGHYNTMIDSNWTHAYYAKYTSNDRTTWVQIFFDANEINEN